MNFFKKQWLEEIKKNWTKKTMVEEDERLNKVQNCKKKKKKDVNDVVQKEICKIYCKTSILYIL